MRKGDRIVVTASNCAWWGCVGRITEIAPDHVFANCGGNIVLFAKSDTAVVLKLNCPECGVKHVDRGEWETRPHKTHLCEACGHLWKPRPFPTVGTDSE